ncbi:MAG: hypothetical protein WA395_16090 [Nitrososphaeraceae archaeon]
MCISIITAFNECSEPSIVTILFENFECGSAAVDEDSLILYDNIKEPIHKDSASVTFRRH